MALRLSKTQLDRLGDRLRSGSRDAVDLQSLDEYRLSFSPALESVKAALHHLRVEQGSRTKTVISIIEKLRRQRIRLTQIQDIAGVRLTCNDAPDQDLLVKYLSITLFPGSDIDDRRERPSHGYRAVHVIVAPPSGHLVEIQVRTRAQHRWAQISEKLADQLDPLIKYGGGPEWARDAMADYSESVKTFEELERQHHLMLHLAHEMRGRVADAATATEHEKLLADAHDIERRVQSQRASLERELERIADLIEKTAGKRRGTDDLPN